MQTRTGRRRRRREAPCVLRARMHGRQSHAGTRRVANNPFCLDFISALESFLWRPLYRSFGSSLRSSLVPGSSLARSSPKHPFIRVTYRGRATGLIFEALFCRGDRGCFQGTIARAYYKTQASFCGWIEIPSGGEANFFFPLYI